MNKVICAVALLVCNVVFAGPPSSTIPHGGEVYVQGQTQEFIYGGRVAKTLTVELSRDGGLTYEMIGTIDNKDRARRNKFIWVVSGASSLNARVKFTSVVGRKTIAVVSSSFIITDRDGLDGSKGDKGDVGPAGSPGIAGLDGKNGRDGRDGLDGKDGMDGSMGNPGMDGLPGKDSKASDVAYILKHDTEFITLTKGMKGDKGVAGEKGAVGSTGPKGDTGLRGPAGECGPAGEDCDCHKNKCKHCTVGNDPHCNFCKGHGKDCDYKDHD